MYAALANCTSALLGQWVALILAAESGRLLRILQVCRSRLIEALRSKLEFLSHIPYTLIGVFWCECGGGLEECKELCRQAFAEYDAAVGDGHSLHRVARRLLDKASSCRRELELWVASVGSKSSLFLAAFWGLLEYALCFLSRERKNGACTDKTLRGGSPECQPAAYDFKGAGAPDIGSVAEVQ